MECPQRGFARAVIDDQDMTDLALDGIDTPMNCLANVVCDNDCANLGSMGKLDRIEFRWYRV